MEVGIVIIFVAFLICAIILFTVKSTNKDIESVNKDDLDIIDARCINNLLHFAHFLGCSITFTHEYNDKKSEDGKIFCVIEKDDKKIAVIQNEEYCTRFFNLQKENS